MPPAQRVEETCPHCEDDTDVWMFKKPEVTIKKECYTCEACGCEWTEFSQD